MTEIMALDTSYIKTESQSIIEHAKSFEIKDTTDYQRAAALQILITDLINKIKETHNPVIEHWSKKHKEAITEREKDLLPLVGAKTILEGKRISYKNYVDIEKAKQEAALYQEEKRKAEELALLTAIQAEESGQKEAADKIIDNPITVAPVILPSAAPKTKGQINRKAPKFRIIDESLIPRQYLIPDNKSIKKVVKALKERHGIPGIEIYYVEKESFRRTRK